MPLLPRQLGAILRGLARVAPFALLGAIVGTVLWIGIGFFVGLLAGRADSASFENAWVGGCLGALTGILVSAPGQEK